LGAEQQAVEIGGIAMNESLDVIIIGAGTAGLAALREVRKRTSNFLLINDGPWGTTCARVGCMPSKVLIEAANAFHRRNTFAEFGITGAGSLRADLPAVLRRVRRLRDDFVGGTLKVTENLGDKAVSGRARLLGPDTVAINGRTLRARKIIIATGSRPIVPAQWPAGPGQLFTTDNLFEEETLPARMAVVGLGAIGVEIAQALSRLGVTVTGFGSEDAVAGISDPAVNAVAVELLRKEFPLHLGRPAEVTAAAGGINVSDGTNEVVVDAVLASLGRRSNSDGLGLDTLGVKLDKRGMPPFDPRTLQIGDLPVFFAGDANGFAPILHEAADEGHIAGLNAMRDDPTCFQRRTPMGIVFSDPGVAAVGQRCAELDQAATITGEVRFDKQGRARAAQHNRGVLRVYVQRVSGRLLGAEMCAPSAEHFAHLLALAISQSLTVHDLLRMPIYHPVLEEGLRTALRDAARQLPKGGESDLASCGALGADALD